MNLQEKMRLNEIIFCNLFKRLLKSNKNPIKVYDFLAATAEVIGANKVILNSILTAILNNDKRYIPTKQEYVHLLNKAGVPIRQLVKMTHISYSTYYSKTRADMLIEPKFDPIQYAEMMKIMKFLDETHEVLEGGKLEYD